jgi:acyl carrier protein
MTDTIEQKVLRTVAEQLGLSTKPVEVKPESEFVNDLGADSLDSVEMLMALEEVFEIEIADEEGEKWKTPADAIAFITELTK